MMAMKQIVELLQTWKAPCLLPKRNVTMWGQPKVVSPALLEKVFGNGQRVICLFPINTRPNYYLVRIDDSWDMNDDGNEMCLRDHLDPEIYEAIDEEFGMRGDKERGCPFERWPEFDYENGCAWEIADETDVPPYTALRA